MLFRELQYNACLIVWRDAQPFCVFEIFSNEYIRRVPYSWSLKETRAHKHIVFQCEGGSANDVYGWSAIADIRKSVHPTVGCCGVGYVHDAPRDIESQGRQAQSDGPNFVEPIGQGVHVFLGDYRVIQALGHSEHKMKSVVHSLQFIDLFREVTIATIPPGDPKHRSCTCERGKASDQRLIVSHPTKHDHVACPVDKRISHARRDLNSATSSVDPIENVSPEPHNEEGCAPTEPVLPRKVFHRVPHV